MGKVTNVLSELMDPLRNADPAPFRKAKSFARTTGGPGHLRKRSVIFWLTRILRRS